MSCDKGHGFSKTVQTGEVDSDENTLFLLLPLFFDHFSKLVKNSIGIQNPPGVRISRTDGKQLQQSKAFPKLGVFIIKRSHVRGVAHSIADCLKHALEGQQYQAF